MIAAVHTLCVRGLLVDIDGTLVDSTAAVEAHWRTFALRYNIDPDQLVSAVHGRRTADVIAGLAGRLPVPVEEATAQMEELDRTDVAGVVALPGARRLLTAVPRHRLALVTSGTRAQVAPRLAAAGLPAVGNFVGGEDVARGKPAPDPYVRGAQLLGLRPDECLAVEDAPPGVMSARGAGCPTLAVLTTHSRAELAAATLIAKDLAAITVVVVAGQLSVTISAGLDGGMHRERESSS
ncbi:MAG TPA: HAD-IA family hydrolase [Candidatus Dormibacteraeota bacterium]